MSKNFELLQRAEQENLAQAAAPTEVAPEWKSSSCVSHGVDERSREQLAKLVHQLFLLPGAPRVVVFAGVDEGDGCSWMTAHTAQMLAAQVSGTVCLLDANLHSPSLHEHFGVGNHRGLSDALRDSGPLRGFLQQLPEARNLWLLSCGSTPAQGETLLSSEKMRLRIAQLRSEFDYLLIDAPALNLYNDAILLGQAADGVALIVQEQSTRKESARKALQDLQQANVCLLGAVLNKRTFPIPNALYKRV
jgi:polysaccharide biosynthesis transport protein